MRCLFCKGNSDNTKSIEHIVPESLGNKSFMLPLGYVCDKCNNFFALKVEKTFLELPEIELLRFHEAVPNKKNRIPKIEGLFNGNFSVRLHRKMSKNGISNEVDVPKEVMDFIYGNSGAKMNIIVPAFTNKTQLKNNIVISRFVAKMALESLAEKLKDVENSLEELVDDKQFDAIRNHARLGTDKKWPCSIRRIYDYDKIWYFNGGTTGQMVHESDFLMIKAEEQNKSGLVSVVIYFVIALWGMEFAINMAEPEIEIYENWLREHNGISPLYYKKSFDQF